MKFLSNYRNNTTFTKLISRYCFNCREKHVDIFYVSFCFLVQLVCLYCLHFSVSSCSYQMSVYVQHKYGFLECHSGDDSQTNLTSIIIVKPNCCNCYLFPLLILTFRFSKCEFVRISIIQDIIF